jgi:hypothetical protein
LGTTPVANATPAEPPRAVVIAALSTAARSRWLVGGVVFRHKISGHPAACGYLETLCPGPVADLTGSAGRGTARAAAATSTGTSTSTPGVADKGGKCLANRAGVLRADVDFVRRAIEGKRNRFLCRVLTVVHIADQQHLYSLRHYEITAR